MLLSAAVFPACLRVIETGSGSGALTTILANFVDRMAGFTRTKSA